MNVWFRRRHWVYTLLVGLLLLDAGIYFGWLRRPASVPGFAEALLSQLTRDAAIREAEVARLRRVREKLPQVRPALTSFIAERFPLERAGYSGLAGDLNEAARTAGVRLGNVTYKVETRQPRADLLAVEVSADLQGGYQNLLRFLEALEEAKGFYLINELAVVSSQRGGLRLQMRLVTYFRRGAS